MNLLVTGGAGFIGSNFIPFMLDWYEDIHIINLDKLTYAGSMKNLKTVENHLRHTFIEGDICDHDLVEEIFKKYKIDSVVHFAAESHVDNSIRNPMSFIDTNVIGTATLLNIAKDFWMSDIGSYKSRFKNARFLHVSTDEVYGTLSTEGYFTEDTPYAPNSPYSASKASSDMLVRSYYYTYGMNVVTTNCSNNYGPNQHDEKLIPTIIRKALALEEIPIYGDGQNVRDWLYVLDHCRAIDKVFSKGKSGETYLIGGQNEKTNIEIAESICDILEKLKPIESSKSNIISYHDLIKFVKDRPGHDFRYAVDNSKLRKELEFELEHSFEKGLEKTVQYYLQGKKA